MNHFEKFSIPAREALKAVFSGIGLSLLIFILAEILLTRSELTTHLILVICILPAGVLSFLLIYFYSRHKHNIKLLEILKMQAATDKLTELYNRSYLDPFLDSEIAAANKFNRQVSMIMVDMDHFKDINDTYGHMLGDHVLTIFAQVVLKCIRKSDIIARYGGDEFIVVLPATDTDTALAIAERIRKEVSNTYIPPLEDQTISSISCSVGVSTYPTLCNSKSNLIRTSDNALYEAKHSGRNCTIVYNNKLAFGE